MKPFTFPSPALTLLWIAVAGYAWPASHAAPFIPHDDAQVLEKLRSTPFDPVARELRQLRSRLVLQPNDLATAETLARRCIELSRIEGDPRYLGYAQSALTPWWQDPQPPIEALVLRATIKQSQHDFPSALSDLDSAVRVAPSHAQAWLTRATIFTVLGRYEEARRSCIPLVRLAPELVALTAAASVASLGRDAERACELLRVNLDRHASAKPAEQLWALTVLAEASERLDHPARAEEYFRRALALGERDVYLLGAYSDFLLDQGRPKEVAILLKDESRVDPLLLRLALAESALAPKPASLAAHLDALRARFEASRLRGDTVHRREEARFTLHLLHQPEESLRLAQANWEVQREPADARVLLEAALAMHKSAAAAPVIDFMTTNKLADLHLRRLANQCNSLAVQ